MRFTRDQAHQALASLNPARVFLDSYQSETLPEELNLYFGPPEEFFDDAESQEPYTGGKLIPILDDGNFGIVTFLDPASRTLTQIDVEAPDEPRTTFRHWQQYLADLMVQIGESVEDDDQLERIAVLIGFTHLDELLEYFDRTESITGDAWWEERRKFPLSIDAD
jgi:hypothetical protein